MKKLLILAVFVGLIALFFGFGLNSYFTLDGLKGGMDNFVVWKEQNPVLLIAGFFAVYVVMAALSLPGAAIMTLASGAIFGLWVGLLISSFASTLGALFAFWVARYVARDSLQKKFPQKLASINEGIEREGAFYLFTLRLVPLFPFFVINMLMALTSIRSFTFYWVSQVGMLAGTFVFVNAGTQLAQIDSLSGILSPNLLISFVLLGVFPLIAKAIVNKVKKRKVYKGYKKPAKYDRNLIVIGAGAAGLVTSYIAAMVKAKVTLIEAGEMGGDCLNYGCVPSKALIKSAKVATYSKNAEKYGLEAGSVKVNFKKVMARVHDVIAQIAPHDSVERYTSLGVDVVKGYATFIDPWTVEIKHNDGEVSRMTARHFVVATGARPFVPPLPGIEDSGYVTSDTLWSTFAELESTPEKMVVLGGGPIGCELAQSFSRLGSDVTQVEMAPALMGREDTEVADFARQTLEGSGVTVLTNHTALRCENIDGQKVLIVEFEGEEKTLPYDQLVCAVGRQARLTGFGLEKLGVETGRTLTTNPFLETNFPHILGAGDVVGPYQFTHVAAHHAWYAAVNTLFGTFKKFKVDYRVIPWATFLDPEIARVGLNERDAKEQGVEYQVFRYDMEELDRAITEGATSGFVKVLVSPGSDKILGVTIISENAGELLAEFVLAMKHGLGLNKILGTIHSYPTWAESNKYVAGLWKQANKPEKILSLLEKYHTFKRG
nr:bifunctional TVP38/TMEM64 family protein/FAD-dependent oxidoreductase [Alteromonas sp. 5E99-2]